MRRICLLIQMGTRLQVNFIGGEADPILEEILTLPRGGEGILVRDEDEPELTPQEIRILIDRSGF